MHNPVPEEWVKNTINNIAKDAELRGLNVEDAFFWLTQGMLAEAREAKKQAETA